MGIVNAKKRGTPTGAEELQGLKLLTREASPLAERADHNGLSELLDVFGKTPAVDVPIEKIHRRPGNRGGHEVGVQEVSDLADSIARFGMRHPILVRPRSGEQELPLGHYELIEGERRVAAWKLMGSVSVPARIVECDDREAALLCNLDNSQREDLGPMAKARAIREAMDRGATEEIAGESVGAPAGTANLLRLLLLPPGLQALVEDGTLGQKGALALVPWVEHPELERQVKRGLKDDVHGLEVGDPWGVQHVLRDCSRPVEAGQKWHVSYKLGGELICEFSAEIFEPGVGKKKQAPKPEMVDEYGLIEVRVNNKPTWIATATKKWDARQAAAVAAKPKAAPKAGGKKAGAAGEGKPVEKVSPAEQRKRDEQSDAELEERITREGGFAELGLRLAIAKKLVLAHWTTEEVYDLLITAARDSLQSTYLDLAQWQYEGARLVVQSRLPAGETAPKIQSRWDRTNNEECGHYLARYRQPEGDPATDLLTKHWHVARLLLWPAQLHPAVESDRLAAPGLVPTRFPAVAQDLLGDMAVMVGASLRDVWEDAAIEGPQPAGERRGSDPYLGAARNWFELWVATYLTRRKLERLAEETGYGTIPAAWTLKDARRHLCEAHGAGGTGKETRLRLPPILREWEKRVVRPLAGAAGGGKKRKRGG